MFYLVETGTDDGGDDFSQTIAEFETFREANEALKRAYETAPEGCDYHIQAE